MARVTFLLTCLLAYLLSSRSLRQSRSSAGRGARRRSHLCSRGASSAAPATDAAIAAEPPSRRLRRRCRFRHRNVYCRLAPHCVDVATQPPASLQPRRPSVSPLVVYTTICYMYMCTVQQQFFKSFYILYITLTVVSVLRARHTVKYTQTHILLWSSFECAVRFFSESHFCFLLWKVSHFRIIFFSLRLAYLLVARQVSDEEVSSLRDTRQMSEGRERRPRRCTRARGAPHRPTRSRRMLQASPSRRLPRTCPQGPTASGMS